MQIGSYSLTAPVVLAPMAGVTDAPYRHVCRSMGAGLVVAEMVASKENLRDTALSAHRFQPDPRDPMPVVQLLGADPIEMASAARYAQDCGAAIVDLNFGCPARVVCGKACGSAIMQDQALAARILQEVVKAVEVPVTLKMRTGWDQTHKNAVTIARIAQDSGVRALTVHGRTRAQRFNGRAEYDTIAEVVRAVSIPVVANGDIDSPSKAKSVLEYTGAAGVMIGRAAYGNPWLLGQTGALLTEGKAPESVDAREVGRVILWHLREHFAYWGATREAVRTFRKHARWYLKRVDGAQGLIDRIVRIDEPDRVADTLMEFFEQV